jgi:phosphatidate phosphatase APP1
MPSGASARLTHGNDHGSLILHAPQPWPPSNAWQALQLSTHDHKATGSTDMIRSRSGRAAVWSVVRLFGA